MYVGWNMKTNLVTITPETSIFKAREMMDAHKISHLPVTDGKAHLLGIVTDRNLKEAWASPATTLSVHELTYVLQKLTVANIMTRKVITATPNMTIERAARIIHDNKIGALPVLKNDRLVGIITTTDLMNVFLMSLGMSDDTKRFSLLVTDRSRVLAEVGSLMQLSGINILSVMIVPLHDYRGRQDGHDPRSERHSQYRQEVWQLIVRIHVAVYSKAVKALEEAGFKVITQYVEDVTPYLPLRA